MPDDVIALARDVIESVPKGSDGLSPQGCVTLAQALLDAEEALRSIVEDSPEEGCWYIHQGQPSCSPEAPGCEQCFARAALDRLHGGRQEGEPMT